MASNKNQHFVPRCYLRSFTKDGANSAINIFNVDHRRFIEGAPVKNQCSRDYFYGEDLFIERALQPVEGRYANVLKEILEPGYQLTDEHKYFLLDFWLLQQQRTEASAKLTADRVAAFSSTASLPDDYVSPDFKECVLLGLKAYSLNRHAVQDLQGCLVKNTSSVPFITSDDPAIHTNRWYLSRHGAQGHTSFGLSHSGALVMLPLSPEVLFLGYDGDVYSVKRSNRWAVVKDDKDVKAFNQHQFLNCNSNVFVRGTAYQESILDDYLEIAPFRLTSKFQTGRLKMVKDDGKTRTFTKFPSEGDLQEGEYMVYTQSRHARPISWPKIIQLRFNGTAYTNGSLERFIRKAQAQIKGGAGYKKVRISK